MRSLRSLLSLLLVAGCGASTDAELLELDSLTPAHLQPGSSIRIDGAGFPAGREAEVRFVGEFRAPGMRPRSVDVHTRAQALSTERIQFEVSRSLIDRLGGRGTFHGTVHVGFGARLRGARVTGRLPDAELDFEPEPARSLSSRLRRARRGQALADALGIRLRGERDSGERGLRVAGVRPNSRGARAGIAAEDRLLSLAGIRLASTADFVPPPGVDAATVRFARPGHADVMRTAVSLEGLGTTAGDARPHPTVLLAVATLLAGLLLFGPAAGLLGRMTSSLRVESSPSGVWSVANFRRAVGSGFAIEVGAMAVALAALPIGMRVLGGYLDVAVVMVVVGLLHGGAAWLVYRAGRSDVARGVRRAAVRMLPVFAVVIVAVFATGTTHLDGIVSAQGAVPWEWIAFAHPAALLVLPALVLSARVQQVSSASHRAAEGAHRVVTSGLAAALLLGGWNTPANWPLAAAVALFVGKALVLWWVAGRVRGPRREDMWSTALSLGAVGVCGAWMWAAPPPAVRAASGPVTCMAAGLVLAYVLWCRRRSVRRAAAPRLHVLF